MIGNITTSCGVKSPYRGSTAAYIVFVILGLSNTIVICAGPQKEIAFSDSSVRIRGFVIPANFSFMRLPENVFIAKEASVTDEQGSILDRGNLSLRETTLSEYSYCSYESSTDIRLGRIVLKGQRWNRAWKPRLKCKCVTDAEVECRSSSCIFENRLDPSNDIFGWLGIYPHGFYDDIWPDLLFKRGNRGSQCYSRCVSSTLEGTRSSLLRGRLSLHLAQGFFKRCLAVHQGFFGQLELLPEKIVRSKICQENETSEDGHEDIGPVRTPIRRVLLYCACSALVFACYWLTFMRQRWIVGGVALVVSIAIFWHALYIVFPVVIQQPTTHREQKK